MLHNYNSSPDLGKLADRAIRQMRFAHHSNLFLFNLARLPVLPPNEDSEWYERLRTTITRVQYRPGAVPPDARDCLALTLKLRAVVDDQLTNVFSIDQLLLLRPGSPQLHDWLQIRSLLESTQCVLRVMERRAIVSRFYDSLLSRADSMVVTQSLTDIAGRCAGATAEYQEGSHEAAVLAIAQFLAFDVFDDVDQQDMTTFVLAANDTMLYANYALKWLREVSGVVTELAAVHGVRVPSAVDLYVCLPLRRAYSDLE